MLAHSLWRKLALTIIVGGGVVWLYEVTVLDSRFASVQSAGDPTPPLAWRAAAVQRHRVLQGHDHRLGRQRAFRHRCRRS